MDFGISFSPGSGDPNQKPAQGASDTPIQDAIKTLSLRVPSFRANGGMAPMPLIGAPGSGGMLPGLGGGIGGQSPLPGGLQQLLQQLFGSMQQQSAPTPSFTPGVGSGGGQTMQAPPVPQPPQMPTMPSAPQSPMDIKNENYGPQSGSYDSYGR